MLSDQDIEKAIAKITYGPCFPLKEPKVYLERTRSRGEQSVIVFEFRAADRDTGKDSTIAEGCFFPRSWSIDMLYQFVRRKWCEAAAHEVDEAFRIDGFLAFDPHKQERGGMF